ncbi:MAG: hypothetical protein ACTHKE_09295 [Sphingomicrobium sp.]
MATLPRDRLVVESKVAQQRTTIEMLKRNGHETADAERYLHQLEEELSHATTSRSSDTGNHAA